VVDDGTGVAPSPDAALLATSSVDRVPMTMGTDIFLSGDDRDVGRPLDRGRPGLTGVRP
jgi:hypothetical protein